MPNTYVLHYLQTVEVYLVCQICSPFLPTWAALNRNLGTGSQGCANLSGYDLTRHNAYVLFFLGRLFQAYRTGGTINKTMKRILKIKTRLS